MLLSFQMISALIEAGYGCRRERGYGCRRERGYGFVGGVGMAL
ncbi:hypothetical protein [Bartonella grahamii]|nr:hypothetical protein [Bartonella grahamii]